MDFGIDGINARWTSFVDAYDDLVTSNRGFRRKVAKLSSWMSGGFAYSNTDELLAYQWALIDCMTYIQDAVEFDLIPGVDPVRQGFELLETMSGVLSDVLGD